MKYFKLGQDDRIPYSVIPTQLNRIHKHIKYRGEDLSDLPNAIASFVQASPVTFYPDILDRQIYMVNGAIKEIFNRFVPELEYKYCCLVDNPNSLYAIYYIPVLEIMDLQQGIAEECNIFRVIDTGKIEVVISLAVLKAILRYEPTGIRVIPIE